MQSMAALSARQFPIESVYAWYWRDDGLSLPYPKSGNPCSR